MEEHKKDINRYSYSRFNTLRMCPRKHHYIYVEQLPTPDNEYTLSGRLFHKCVEMTLKGEDCTPIYEDYKDYCRRGIIKNDPDTMQYVVDEYFRYYGKQYMMENTIASEEELTKPLIDNDYMVMVVDQIFEDSGYLGIRDMKTTSGPLKYTHDQVKLNSQLLLYMPAVEEKLGRKVDFIEIDEVRLAKMADVPLKSNGKPSTDKKLLSLVPYEDYLNALMEQGLEKNAEYQNALEYLSERGHPLFNRIRVQIVDRNVIDNNNEEMMDLYMSAQSDPKYRVVGQQCMNCPFRSLCEQDCYKVDGSLREKIIENL